jgi:hypothetical protein
MECSKIKVPYAISLDAEYIAASSRTRRIATGATTANILSHDTAILFSNHNRPILSFLPLSRSASPLAEMSSQLCKYRL